MRRSSPHCAGSSTPRASSVDPIGSFMTTARTSDPARDRDHSADRAGSTAWHRPRSFHGVVRLEHHAADRGHRRTGGHRICPAFRRGCARAHGGQPGRRHFHGAARGAGPHPGRSTDGADPGSIRVDGVAIGGGNRHRHVRRISRLEPGHGRGGHREPGARNVRYPRHRAGGGARRRGRHLRLRSHSCLCAGDGLCVGAGIGARFRVDHRDSWPARRFPGPQCLQLAWLPGRHLHGRPVADRVRALCVGLLSLHAAGHRRAAGVLGELLGLRLGLAAAHDFGRHGRSGGAEGQSGCRAGDAGARHRAPGAHRFFGGHRRRQRHESVLRCPVHPDLRGRP